MEMVKEEDLKNECMEVIEFGISDNSNNGKYAFDIKCINEVFKVKKVTPLPCTPSFIIGIINYRGKILSVIDIRKFLGFSNEPKDFNDVEKVIIVKFNELEVGIAIDKVIGYYTISMGEIQKNILTIADERKEFIIGITTGGTLMLDIKSIMLSEKITINDSVYYT